MGTCIDINLRQKGGNLRPENRGGRARPQAAGRDGVVTLGVSHIYSKLTLNSRLYRAKINQGPLLYMVDD